MTEMTDMKERNVSEWSSYDGEGYKVLVKTGKWRFAFLRWAERFSRQDVLIMERHRTSDEVFLLTEGEAVILEAGNGDRPEHLKKTPLEKGVVCNIPKDVWHQIHVSRDALVVIAEDADVSPENTEKLPCGEWAGGDASC